MAETNPRKVYVGNLPRDYTQNNLREEFSKFGQIRRIEFKGRFGFIEYDSPSAASESVSVMNGATIGSERIQVKSYHYISSSKRQSGYYASPGRHPPSDSHRNMSRTPHRVLVLGLNPRTNWQDLKDFGRKVGLVNYADVTRGPDGALRGILEFQDAGAMVLAIERLDGTELLGYPVQLAREKTISPRHGRMSPDSYGRSETNRRHGGYKSSSYMARGRSSSPSHYYQHRKMRSRSPVYYYHHHRVGSDHPPPQNRYLHRSSYQQSPPPGPLVSEPGHPAKLSVSPPRGNVRRPYREGSASSRRPYNRHRQYYEGAPVPAHYSPPPYHHGYSTEGAPQATPYDEETPSHHAPPMSLNTGMRRGGSPTRQRVTSGPYYHRY